MVLKRGKFWFNVHLISTFICALPLLVVAITGAIISYHDEIIDLLNESSSNVVKSADKPLEIDEILSIFSERNRGFRASFISTRNDENKAIKISGLNGENKFDGFLIDPYTAQIVGENLGDKFIGVVLSLHENLGLAAFGKRAEAVGRHISAISTMALILLIISGVIIHYPNFRAKFKRAFRINLKAKGYSLWYQIHSALGMYSAVILLIICVTGLYFSYDWLARATNKMLDEDEIFRRGSFTQNVGISLDESENLKEIKAVFEIFKRERGDDYEIFNVMIPPKGGAYNGVYTDKGVEDEEKINMMLIDAKNDKILRRSRYDDLKNSTPNAMKITKTILNLHAGYTFGEAGKFIFALASSLVVVFMISGFYMMIKRVKRRA